MIPLENKKKIKRKNKNTKRSTFIKITNTVIHEKLKVINNKGIVKSTMIYPLNGILCFH